MIGDATYGYGGGLAGAGTGIWCGMLFAVSGGIGVIAANKISKCRFII